MAIDTSIALGVRPPQFQTIDPMTIYSAMEGQRLNALRERALEQEMQRNALIMQNTMEDRRAAAAKAAAARREQEELIRLFQGGYQPAKNPVMGPGTIQGATPAGFDYEGVKNKLIGAGRIDAFKTVSELQEQEAKRREAEAKATGQGFTNTKTQAETLGVLTENQKKTVELADAQLKQISMGIDRAPSIEAVNMLYDASPEALAVTGKTPAQAKAIFAQRVAEVGFDRARMEVAQGVFATAKQLSDMAATQKPELKTISGVGLAAVNPYTAEAKPVTVDGKPIPTGDVVPDLKKGERWNAEKGRVEAVPGSDIYVEQSQKHGKDVSAVKTVEESTKSVTDTINRILDPAKAAAFNSNFGGSTYLGSRYIPGETQDVAAAIETLKSQMKMAGASLVRARGGAVGAITEREWPYLESMIDTLTPNMTEGEARRVIQSVGERLKALNDISKETYDATWGNTQYYKPTAGGTKDKSETSDKSIFDAADAILGGK